MRGLKATLYRPACGYAAATVCAAIAAWGAASPPPTLGIMQALYQTDRDTQLPLERFAVGAEHLAASSSLPPVSPPPRSNRQPQWSQQLPRQTAQPSRAGRRISAYVHNGATRPEHTAPGPDTARRSSGVNGYYLKIDDWKHWT
jgi:hypothetical protein